jgi:DNA-directed RNA polymerase specialized sigma24 family protein
MSSAGSVTRLIRRAETGDGEAARILWTRYWPRLVGLARRKLRGKHPCTANEEDAVGSALAAFFIGAARGQFTQLHDREDLWHLLVKITRNKVGHLLKYENAQKRNPDMGAAGTPRHEAPLIPPEEIDLEQAVDPCCAPDVVVAAEEEANRLLALLGDDTLRSIAVWKWEGYANEEIAVMLSCSLRTVERKLKLIRKLWAREGVS